MLHLIQHWEDADIFSAAEIFIPTDCFSHIAMSVGDTSEHTGRFCVLSWEQVQRLDSILGEPVPIHGRGNFPTLSVKPRQIVQVKRQNPYVLDAMWVRDFLLSKVLVLLFPFLNQS